MPRRPEPRCWRAAASRPMRRPAATTSRRCCSAASIRSAQLAQEEVFGPVLALFPFDDEEQAVALANGTEYGLSPASGPGMAPASTGSPSAFVQARSSSMPMVLAAASNCPSAVRQVGPRPRKRLRGALRHVGHQDDRVQSMAKAGTTMRLEGQGRDHHRRCVRLRRRHGQAFCGGGRQDRRRRPQRARAPSASPARSARRRSP